MANANSTMDVEFSLAGKSCKMPFLITEITAGDALIGIDWLTAHNAWIHASKCLLVFLPDSTKMYLNLEFDEKMPNKLMRTVLQHKIQEYTCLNGLLTTTSWMKSNGRRNKIRYSTYQST